MALAWVTNVVELSFDRIRAKSRLGNAGQVGDHAAADGVVGCRRKISRSLPSGVPCGAGLGRICRAIGGGVYAGRGHFGDLH